MKCRQSEYLLMRYDALTESEKEQLAAHAESCVACAQALELIQVEQTWVNKFPEQPEPAHAAALTHKIMQALPKQKSFSFGFLNLTRIAYAAGSLALFFWLGSELLIEKTFNKPTPIVGPVLNSSRYISDPQQPETKPVTLTERLKSKGYDIQ
ncbi:MAG TPA: hypothetical protein PLM56_16490 [Cyclobacteriaceae bacterium]|jgi:hypothetical protein|nr:zf-HC2 domain-containing protein [Cytophagales bacterium]HNT49517.1 hypothetical protein [Cyclobacteriaceae bacterium]HRE65302.1 hypothetical protein [Cyclobacteriaceae bacterium]HRF35106.1 hypothetical protein [Cyclobacteriaceae bacterium]